MKSSSSIIGAILLACSTTVFANVPTQSYIKKTIMNNFISGDMEPNQAKIHSTKPIYLLNGEQAYISNIEFGLTGRNFSGAYVLTRPKVNQSAIVFGPSQGDEFKIHNTKNGNTNVSIISFTTGDSGQGSVYEKTEYVYFNGWMPKTVVTANNEFHEDYCKSNDSRKEVVTLNLQAKTYSKKTSISKKCSNKYSVISNKTNPIVFINNDKEANQPFSIKIVDGFHDEGPLEWNEVRIIPSMTYKENGEVVASYFEIAQNKSITPFQYTLQCKNKKFSQTYPWNEDSSNYFNIFETHSHGDQNDTAIYTYNKYCK